jgi:hypothetical protein
MPIYILPKPEAMTESDDAGRIHEWLSSIGYAVDWAAIDIHGVTVSANRSPAADLASYVPTPTSAERQRAEMLGALQSLDLEADPDATKRAIEVIRDLMLDGVPLPAIEQQ